MTQLSPKPKVAVSIKVLTAPTLPVFEDHCGHARLVAWITPKYSVGIDEAEPAEKAA